MANATPSPTIDPSVRTILIGHSMGGIVAAETILAITGEQPISATGSAETNSFMFPYIQGLLAFDTPFLGIAPGVVAHGAEGHYRTATTAWSALTEVAGVFGWRAGGSKSESDIGPPPRAAIGALPVGPEAAQEAAMSASASVAQDGDADAAAMPAWQRWGKYAMFAGAAGAVAAGGAAAYMKRDTISSGWTWVGSHLEFVGCLARGAELRQRTASIANMTEERGLGFANLYTNLGFAAKAETDTVSSGLLGDDRTFCSLPKEKSDVRRFFVKTINDKAADETLAHMAMFYPRDNPGYYAMCEKAKELVVGWAGPGNDWYESSTRTSSMEDVPGFAPGEMVVGGEGQGHGLGGLDGALHTDEHVSGEDEDTVMVG